MCFYQYIVAAKCYNYFSSSDIQNAYGDGEFVEYLLRHISQWKNKREYDLDEWLDSCWHYIIQNYTGAQLQKYAELFLRSADDIENPKEELLDKYIEATSKCSQKDYLSLNILKLLNFFNCNTEKTCNLISSVLPLQVYIDVNKLREIVNKYKELGLTGEAKKLLNLLLKNGKITNHTKEQLAKILE